MILIDYGSKRELVLLKTFLFTFVRLMIYSMIKIVVFVSHAGTKKGVGPGICHTNNKITSD
jgi:hypothetical protein